MPKKPPREIELTIATEQITPEIVATWLKENNPTNRNCTESNLAKLTLAMQRGEFIVGDSIKFDYNDELIDGQHRLTAIVRSGVTIALAVVRGYAPEAKGVLDIGKRRSTANIAKIMGHDHIGQREISCLRSMLLPYNSKRNHKNLLSPKQEIDLTLAFFDSINFVTSHKFMRGSLARTAVAGAIARAYISGENHLRLTQFMDIFGGTYYSDDKCDLAAIRLREAFLSRNAKYRRSLSEEFELTQSALRSFIVRKPRQVIRQVSGSLFDTLALDAMLEQILPGFTIISNQEKLTNDAEEDI